MFVKHFFTGLPEVLCKNIFYINQYKLVVPILNCHFQSKIVILNHKIVILQQTWKKTQCCDSKIIYFLMPSVSQDALLSQVCWGIKKVGNFFLSHSDYFISVEVA